MSKISLTPNASGTGNFTIASPNSNTDRTLTLPDNTGTIITTASTFGGTGPAFSVYRSTNQNVTGGTTTKVQFQSENFDTNSNYDNSTNYRFTPTVAGYYQINAGIQVIATTQINTKIYKNGTDVFAGFYAVTNLADPLSTVSALIYCNGSTDYIEIYVYVSASGYVAPNANTSYFNGFLARAA